MRPFAPLAATWILLAAVPAAADAASVERAHAAYERAAADYDAGRYQAAAEGFARADELAPNPTALQMGVTAAVRADDAELGMTLVERADQRGLRGTNPAVETARQRFADRVGSVIVACPSACTVTIDGISMAPGVRRWVVVGPHEVDVDVGGTLQSFPIGVQPQPPVTVQARLPAGTASVSPAAAPSPLAPSAPEAPTSGLSPIWFWAGAAITLGLAGTSIASSLDTIHQHDVFLRDPTNAGASDGRSAQLRTNILWGATAAAAAATVLVGVVFVRWRASPTPRSGAVPPRAWLGGVVGSGGASLLGLW